MYAIELLLAPRPCFWNTNKNLRRMTRISITVISNLVFYFFTYSMMKGYRLQYFCLSKLSLFRRQNLDLLMQIVQYWRQKQEHSIIPFPCSSLNNVCVCPSSWCLCFFLVRIFGTIILAKKNHRNGFYIFQKIP